MTDDLLDDSEDPQIDPNKDYLADLVGEDKKYKSNEDLAKAYAHADSYIEMLTKERDEFRPEYQRLLDESKTRARLEDLIAQLEGQQSLTSREDNTHNSNEDTKPAYDPTQVESLISSKIQQHEQTKKETDNYNKVMDRLSERFGSNYKNVLKEQAKSLGLDNEDVNLMARKNPNLFFKTFDLNARQTETFESPTRSDVQFAPKTKEKRGWNYYQKLRENNPQAWLDPKIAVQMDKDLQAMGRDEFYAN